MKLIKKKRSKSSLPQKHSLGQVFLRNQISIDEIVRIIDETKSTRLLEVGPGEGVLTLNLAKQRHVTAIEKDHRFALMLQLKNIPTLKIIEADFLDFDLQSWLQESMEPTSVVGNIPYNISTPLLMKIIPVIHLLEDAVFMVQKEFADRVSAPCGGKNYGSLSVFCALRCKIEILLQVSRNDFSPVPQVDSSVIRIQKIPERLSAEILQATEKLTRHVFTQRRKKLSNSMKPFLNNAKTLEGAPVDFNKRPEELSPAEFVTLAQWLFL